MVLGVLQAVLVSCGATYAVLAWIKLKLILHHDVRTHNERRHAMATDGPSMGRTSRHAQHNTGSPTEDDEEYIESPFIRPPLLFNGFDCTDGSLRANVPHSHYLPSKRRRSIHSLIDADVNRIEQYLPQFLESDIDLLYQRIRHEGLWVSAINLSEALERRDGAGKVSRVETTLHTLLEAEKPAMALQYFRRNAAVPICQELYPRLFKAVEPGQWAYAMLILDATKRHRVKRDDTLSVAAIESFCQADWVGAMSLYANLRSAQWAVEKVPSDLPADSQYHVPSGIHRKLIPCVASQSGSYAIAEALCADMAQVARPEIGPALLASLGSPVGQAIARNHLHRHFPSQSGVRMEPQWVLASKLFTLHPSDDALEHLSIILLRDAPEQWSLVDKACGTIGKNVTDSTALAIAKRLSLASHGRWRWMLASRLAERMMAARKWSAVPLLAETTANCGRWAMAATMCTQLFARRQRSPSQSELHLCVQASIEAGKWSSAMFWIERAHARGMTLPSHLYDAAFVANQKTTWDASLSAFVRMRSAGTNCGEDGVMALLSQAGEQRNAAKALEVLSWTDSIQWKK